MAVNYSSIYKMEEIWGKEIIFNITKFFKIHQNPGFAVASSLGGPPFFLPFHQMEERKGGQEENEGQTLALQESGRCVTLVALKDLSWRISRRDRVQSSRMTSQILAST